MCLVLLVPLTDGLSIHIDKILSYHDYHLYYILVNVYICDLCLLFSLKK